MGVFGDGLYDDDVAMDVKDDFLKVYNKGKDPILITEALIRVYQDSISDEDEAPVFWYALADVEWTKGVLQEKVKEKALDYIDLQLGKDGQKSEYKLTSKRKAVLTRLKLKLLSPQPPVKPPNLKIPKVYRCSWEIGDTYALPLVSDCAKEKGVYGEYLVLHKVAEVQYCGSENSYPVLWIKLTNGAKLPSNAQEFNNLKFIQTGITLYEDRFLPFSGARPIEEQIAEKSKIAYITDEYGFLPQYRVTILDTSKRAMPKTLVFLGNFKNTTPPNNEFVPHENINVISVFWKNFEKKIINSYFYHTLHQGELYTKN